MSAPEVCDVDRHGVDVLGSDDDGIWYGTDAAYLVLSDSYPEGDERYPCTPSPAKLWHLVGYLGSQVVDLYAVASSEERVRSWFAGIGGSDVSLVEHDGEASPSVKLELYGCYHVPA